MATSDHAKFMSNRYLILHFELNTEDDKKRDDAYKAIREIARPTKLLRLTGSVYMAPVPSGVETWAFSLSVWNALAKATKGKLFEGDRFFLH